MSHQKSRKLAAALKVAEKEQRVRTKQARGAKTRGAAVEDEASRAEGTARAEEGENETIQGLRSR
jgi:hypothetical protein